MNDFRYLPRAAGASVESGLEAAPVLVVTGARQTGKSTLVRHLPALSEHLYVTLDDLDVADEARREPERLLSRSPRMILDEVQRAPELVRAVKRVVDQGREPGRFVLTGSANLLLMKEVSESLAGRAIYVTLWPMTGSELSGEGGTGRWSELFEYEASAWLDRFGRGRGGGDWRERAVVGGYPVPALEQESPEARTRWFDGYVRTYLERDLQELSSIDNLADYRRLMRAVALRTGGIENQTDIARDIGVSPPTAHRWMNLLETSYQLVRVEPYAVNRTKRLVKSPHLYWSDPGLGLFLAGAEPGGVHLENLILADLLAWRDTRVRRPEVLYWRTHAGAEVDFVIERDGELVAIEVKAARRPAARDTRHIRTFREEYPDRFRGGLLLHDGDDTFWTDDGVLAVPWGSVL